MKIIILQAFGFLCLFEFCASPALGQDSADVDHSAVLELGAAGEWGLKGNSSNFGGTLAMETTPIEHWLELEFGATALATSGQTELSADFLFKKPYRLSRTSEFMMGVGPELVRKFNGDGQGTSLGWEAVLDFMFWPTNNIGWYLEPGYDLVPSRGDEQSLGITGGLIIGWQ
jgi:hypothetical protein